MLLLAVLLLFTAGGLLVVAIVTGQIGLAWVSVGASAVAAIALLAWRRRSRRRRIAAGAEVRVPGDAADGEIPVPGDEVSSDDEVSSSDGAASDDAAASSDAALPEDEPVHAGQGASSLAPAPKTAEGLVDPDFGPGRAGPDEVAGADPDHDETVEPGDEDTDADLPAVVELSDEVLVVDGQSHYHLARCRWPDPAKTERLPVREARELGFGPCGRCRPDVEIVRRQRAATTG